MTQLKAVKELIDSDMEASKKEQLELDEQRLTHLRLIGNIVHDSVVVHNDEVCFYYKTVDKVWGEARNWEAWDKVETGNISATLPDRLDGP